jgi:hypothetical protein
MTPTINRQTTLRAEVAHWIGARWLWQGEARPLCMCAPGVVTDCIHFVAHVLERTGAMPVVRWPAYPPPFSGGVREQLFAGLREHLDCVWHVWPRLLARADATNKQMRVGQSPELRDGDVLVFRQGRLDAFPALVYDAGRNLIASCSRDFGVRVESLEQSQFRQRLIAVFRVREEVAV